MSLNDFEIIKRLGNDPETYLDLSDTRYLNPLDFSNSYPLNYR
jgi:hypothetical protein